MEVLFQTIGLLAAAAGVWVSWLTYLSGKRMEVFQIYVDKFERVITADDILWWSYLLEGAELPEYNKDYYEVKILQYLNLAWEEYYLYSQGMISPKLWRIWEPGIIAVLKTDFAQEVFNKHKNSFEVNFIDWAESHLHDE